MVFLKKMVYFRVVYNVKNKFMLNKVLVMVLSVFLLISCNENKSGDIKKARGFMYINSIQKLEYQIQLVWLLLIIPHILR